LRRMTRQFSQIRLTDARTFMIDLVLSLSLPYG
jgi:hypothetical protein